MKQPFNLQITVFLTCVYARVYTHLCKNGKVTKHRQKTPQMAKRITNIKTLFIH